MAEAKRDQNHVPTMLATSSTDGTTTLPIYANPANNNGLSVDSTTVPTDKSDGIGDRDQNHVVAFMAVSAVDGVTPVEVYANPVGNKLYIQTS